MSSDTYTKTLSAEEKLVREIEEKCNLGNPWSTNGLPNSHDHVLETVLKPYLEKKAKNFCGFQANQKMDFSDIGFALNMHINNIGDAYQEGSFRCSTKAVERNVVSYFSKLWGAPNPGRTSVNPEDIKQLTEEEREAFFEEAWGYTLAMGSTEGNLYALRTARDYLKGKYHNTLQDVPNSHGQRLNSLARAKRDDSRANLYSTVEGDEDQVRFKYHKTEPVIFYSASSHYSISKIKDLLEIYTPDVAAKKFYKGEKCPVDNSAIWPTKVPSHIDGTTNIESLAKLVKFFTDRGHPVIICCNYGTT
eukprot:TRINITY_DN7495_c0_g1_i1.p1 TRINITY_DN7495_c0_g1~~TRINITY_DN7495_c0_g1_i1.p1  ORF type:complete len:305 (-),score=45.30 TRINITY_DN7495_c0_g1_i1:1069-1983(-)